ncbi:hypothetical protein EDB85DRAFT_2275556 [Lactarius pseudohatsudake]|nr:hypothetical protein EDB85DRAFT_2275556 [Lactarius pseudohatsudake]
MRVLPRAPRRGGGHDHGSVYKSGKGLDELDIRRCMRALVADGDEAGRWVSHLPPNERVASLRGKVFFPGDIRPETGSRRCPPLAYAIAFMPIGPLVAAYIWPIRAAIDPAGFVPDRTGGASAAGQAPRALVAKKKKKEKTGGGLADTRKKRKMK